MTREYAQNQQVVCDLFGRESGGYPTAYDDSKADKRKARKDNTTAEPATPCTSAAKVKPQFSEDLWEDALKRHCDARQNLRSLLDRYIKPHH